jgi:hypothetical protein
MNEGHSATLDGSCKLHWKDKKLNLVTFCSACYTNEIDSFDCVCQLVGMMLRGSTLLSVCRSYLEVLFLF